MTTVLALGAPQRFRVVGIVKFGTADSPGGASVALFTTPVAQRLVAGPGKVTSVLFVAKPSVSQQQLAASLRTALPHGMEAVTGATITKEMQTSFQQGMAYINNFMMIFAVIALLVGAFMIFNTFSITVAQRTRENGLLRALGANKRQVLGSVLAEAVAVGIIASAIGLAAGIAVAAGLKALLSGLGYGLPAGGIVFSSTRRWPSGSTRSRRCPRPPESAPASRRYSARWSRCRRSIPGPQARSTTSARRPAPSAPSA